MNVEPAYGGYDEVEVQPSDPDSPGLRLWVTRIRRREAPCRRGHRRCDQPPRAAVLPE
ncbi:MULTISPECIES: hypothetical protein [Candidatus Accumulibacter]|uniref:hypothetical protein n=1 Tax=Candidatus Accumulibacter TaxID=327159 RepID=UPI000B0CBD8B|nr:MULTISPECIES: hypothetical protein [Candidatus Accumulibacter]MBL8401961.1 hypothetical protein [Accumulibacter sp.]MBN8517394.1 hypothetical protein [Accumulibacter sp.]